MLFVLNVILLACMIMSGGGFVSHLLGGLCLHTGLGTAVTVFVSSLCFGFVGFAFRGLCMV